MTALTNFIKQRSSPRRIRFFSYTLLVGVAIVLFQILQFGGLHKTAMFYMLMPFSLGLLHILTLPPRKPESPATRFRDFIFWSLALILCTSVILREGFICVLYMLPIYLMMMFLAYWVVFILQKSANRGERTFAHVIPALVMMLSFEGTTESLSFERDNSVVFTTVVNSDVNTIRSSFDDSFDLNLERHWMLEVFPMPHSIDQGPLKLNQIRRVETRYHRWFVTNTHEGAFEMKISQLDDQQLTMNTVGDSTYFSSYLNLRALDISLQPAGPNHTQIRLQIDYERRMDPAWYFGPLQSYAVTKMAELMIRELASRG